MWRWCAGPLNAVPTGWNSIREGMRRRIPRTLLRSGRTRLCGGSGGGPRLSLGLNAGHDLNLDNLRYFISRIPFTDEVSIGHALISMRSTTVWNVQWRCISTG